MLKVFKILFNVMIVAIMLMLTMAWFWKNDAFKLMAIKIQGNRLLTREQIFELAAVDFSQNVFEVDIDEIEQRLESYPLIEKVTVSRFLPSTIKIKVQERELIALLSQAELVAVDIAGNIISQFPPGAIYDLPVITGLNLDQDRDSGTQMLEQRSALEKIVHLLKEIKSYDILLYIEISEIYYGRNSGIVIYLKRSNLPVILGNDDLLRKVIYFSTIYHHLLKKGVLNQALVIDIRFDNQVVVKQKS